MSYALPKLSTNDSALGSKLTKPTKLTKIVIMKHTVKYLGLKCDTDNFLAQ